MTTVQGRRRRGDGETGRRGERTRGHGDTGTRRGFLRTQDPGLSPWHPALSPRTVGTLAALGAVFIWGLSFVPSKVALVEMGSFTLAVLRFSVALLVVLAVALRSRPAALLPREVSWRTLALLGFTGIAMFYAFQNLGLMRTSATDASMIGASVPAVTAALAAAVYRKRMPLPRILGIVVSMAGVALVALTGGSRGGASSLEGDLMIFGCALAWAVYTLVSKEAAGKLPQTLFLLYTMGLGTLFLIPPMVGEVALSGFGPVSTVGWLSVLFLGVVGSAAALFCWNAAVRRLEASEAAVYTNLVPVVTAVTASLLLHETLEPAQLLGGAVVLLGVYLAGR